MESVVTRFDQISNNDEIIDIYIYLTKVTSFFIDSTELHILSNTLISLNQLKDKKLSLLTLKGGNFLVIIPASTGRSILYFLG